MVAPRRLACVAAALAPSAWALRQQAQEHSGGARVKTRLNNLNDVQYYGDITIGGQNITGILDTGSFELVVFSSQCQGCGIAGKFSDKSSKTYRKGSIMVEHSYGSGSCLAVDGFDDVEIDGLSARNQSLWLTMTCQMPLLEIAQFNSIVGMGPPGQPVMVAKLELEELEGRARNYGSNVPRDLLKALYDKKQELEVAKTKSAMLENFGVTTFSECLGKEPGSPGWLIWNDRTRQDLPGVQRIPISGKITWGFSATNLVFTSGSYSKSAACQDGCGAIVDTGTSLFAVPTKFFLAINNALDEYMNTQLPPDVPPDCSDISHFPDLVLNLGGEQLSFPPSSYIGRFVGQMNKEMEQFVRLDRLSGSACQLLMLDLGTTQDTSLGPLIILGMPFFREYYTTFDLGDGDPESRSLFVSRSSDSCEPTIGGAVSTHKERGAHAYTGRSVDVSKLRMPKSLARLKGQI